MKTIDNRRIHSPFRVILNIVLLCGAVFGLMLWLTVYEFFVNLFLFTVALGVLWLSLVSYPLVRSKSNNSLIGPFILIIAASVLLGVNADLKLIHFFLNCRFKTDTPPLHSHTA